MQKDAPLLESFRDGKAGVSGWRIRLTGRRAIPTPAVRDGRVFVGGGFGSHEFYAFDARTGQLSWQLHTSDDGPTAAVVSDGVVAFNTESCTLEVVDAAKGEVVWSRWLGDPLLAQPAIAAGRVFMVYPKDGRHWIGAFRLRAGLPLWDLPLGHDVITAPVYAEGRLYLSTFDGDVTCIDPDVPRTCWKRRMQATSAPWVYRGEVYVSQREDAGESNAGQDAQAEAHVPAAAGATVDDGVSQAPAIAARARAAAWPRERTSRLDAFGGGMRAAYEEKAAPYLSARWGDERKRRFLEEDAAVGFAHAPIAAKLQKVGALVGEAHVSRTWRFQGSRPVVAEGILYDTTGDALEAKRIDTGEVLWVWRDAAPVAGERRLTPPAVAGGRVLAGTWDGRALCWDAATGALRWQVQLGGPCHWQPSAANGWVYAGLENGTLVAFDTGDPALDGWPMWGGGPGHNGQSESSVVRG